MIFLDMCDIQVQPAGESGMFHARGPAEEPMMPQYNEMFELSVEDMDLIETALRRTKDALWHEQLAQPGGGRDDRDEDPAEDSGPSGASA